MSIYVRDAGGNRQKIAGVGLPGPAGKSAYQYAVEGGFSGTEEEFRAVVGIRNNDNLLDNWYLADPINQRGQTEYIDFGYTIDRFLWYGNAGKLQVLDRVIRISNNGNSNVYWGTAFESQRLSAGQVYTASVIASTDVLVLVWVEGLNDIAVGTNFVTFTMPSVPENRECRMTIINADPSAVYDVTAFKLELGPVQTLAHKDASGNWVLNDPPPNKALELAKCQRYQYTPFLNFTGYGDIADGWVWHDTATLFILHLPTMHRTPALIVDDVTKFRITAKTSTGVRNDIIPTAIIAPTSIGNCIKLQATVDSSYGMEPGSACELWVDQAQGTVPLLFDANL